MSKDDMNLKELSFDALKGGMDKPSFEKAIKKATTWKNKKAIILLTNFKIAEKGAKRAVAIPFKKIGDAKNVFKKQIKTDASILMKNIFIGYIDFDKEDNGETVAKIQKVLGNASEDLVLKQGGDLFSLMGFKLEVLTKKEGKQEKIKKEDGNDSEAFDAASLNIFYNDIDQLLSGKIGVYQLLELENLIKSFKLELKKYRKENPDGDISHWAKLLKKSMLLLEKQKAHLVKAKEEIAVVNKEIEALQQLLKEGGFQPMPTSNPSNSPLNS